MGLGQGGPQFPFQQYLQAKQQSEPMAVAGQALGGINLPAIIDAYKREAAKQALQKALLSMRGSQAPTTAGVDGAMNPMQPPQISSGTPDLSSLFDLGQTAYGANNPFKSMLSDQFDPLKQSQIAKNLADAKKASGVNGDSMVDVYQDAKGNYARVPGEGFSLIGKVPLKEAYQYEAAGKLANAKAGLGSQKEISKQWNDLQKTINPFRSQGFGGAASTFNRAAVSNQAAARGLKILDTSLTWQELNAYINTDIASIQRSGTPTDVQLHESNYNTLLGKIGGLNTFLTGKPTTGLVPKETRDHIRQIIMDIISVDNRIIDDGIDYAESAYPDAIAAFPKRWATLKEKAQKIKTVGQDVKLGANPVAGENGGWSYVGPVGQ